jgi:hypothetical protein
MARFLARRAPALVMHRSRDPRQLRPAFSNVSGRQSIHSALSTGSCSPITGPSDRLLDVSDPRNRFKAGGERREHPTRRKTRRIIAAGLGHANVALRPGQRHRYSLSSRGDVVRRWCSSMTGLSSPASGSRSSRPCTGASATRCSGLNGWIASPKHLRICGPQLPRFSATSCITSRRSAEVANGPVYQVAGNLTVATVPGAPASGTMS